MMAARRRVAPRTITQRVVGCLAPWAACWTIVEDRAIAAGLESAPRIPVRNVRILLANDMGRVRITSPSPISVHAGSKPLGDLPPAGTAAWVDGNGMVLLGETKLGGSELILRPKTADPIELSFQREDQWSAEIRVPGTVRLRGASDATLEVVNDVDLEQYVACVTAVEAWPTFDVEAFRVQAIVARTFVLYQMTRRPDAAIDVSATQGSQVYRGLRDDAAGRKAAEAADYTRGLVLTFDDHGVNRLFCAYYSAACGGMSQPAKMLGAEGDVEPLRGGVRCDYCKIAPGDAYRWGPVTVPVGELLERLLDRYPEMSDLGRVASIAPLERTPGGRLLSIRITGTTGGVHDLIAERFRLAVGGSLIRSTDCRIRVAGDDVIFDQGKGFGHGLGLCQWGAEGLARSGKQAAEILRFYYPNSKLTRVY